MRVVYYELNRVRALLPVHIFMICYEVLFKFDLTCGVEPRNILRQPIHHTSFYSAVS